MWYFYYLYYVYSLLTVLCVPLYRDIFIIWQCTMYVLNFSNCSLLQNKQSDLKFKILYLLLQLNELILWCMDIFQRDSVAQQSWTWRIRLRKPIRLQQSHNSGKVARGDLILALNYMKIGHFPSQSHISGGKAHSQFFFKCLLHVIIYHCGKNKILL